MIYLLTADGGHGMSTGGKRTPKFSDGSFMHEREFNQAVIVNLQEMAKAIPNFVFFDVSPENNDVPLETRVKRANAKLEELQKKYGASNVIAAHVSIHANAHTGDWGTANGQETFYSGSVEGKKLATAIHTELVKGTKLTDRGIKTANFYMIKQPKAASALVEAAFMDNKKEAELLRSNAFRKEVAQEVLQGVLNYFNINSRVEPIKEEVKKKYFRIRKSWTDSASQKGAYENLDNAIADCKILKGYNVYDDDGKLVYQDRSTMFSEGLDKIKREAERKEEKIKKKKWFFKK